MKWSNLKELFGALILAVSSLAPALAAGTIPDKPQSVSVSLGTEVSSGSYGTGTTTRSVYTPLTVTWSANERFDLGIELPFLYQNNNNVTTDLYRSSPQSTAAAVAKGGPGGARGTQLPQVAGGAGGAGGTTASGSADSAVSGLGDIILRMGVIAAFEGAAVPQVRPSLFVKIPTASTADGLGTGEFDAGLGVDMTKWLGDMHLIGEGVYTWQGRTAGFGLKNYLSYSAGLGYQLTGTIEPMLLVKGATAPSDYSSELLELRARIIWALSENTSLDLYGSRGLADSSPEYGGGVSVIYSF